MYGSLYANELLTISSVGSGNATKLVDVELLVSFIATPFC